jgi:superfamily II DNA/RNA helicase/HKD family nuclease
MKKEIVDNETDSYTMADFIREALQRTRKIDIASGFFNVSGFAKVKEELWQAANKSNFNMRLLFGKETAITENPDLANCVDIDTTLNEELAKLAITEETAKLIDNLIEYFKQPTVEIRKNPRRFNHAKCYIFDDAAAVGSSNFTGAGLATNIELNAILYQPSAQEKVREWFERRWKEGEDAKTELIDMLESSKFGLPLEPFKMYMKFLYEYYKPRLEELERERGKVVELTTFQEDAVNTAIRIIKKFNGVLVADSTGLGKTHIGLELLREFVAVKRKKALLIAPSQVLDTVWEPKLLDESIKTKNVTLESTGTESFHPEDHINYDVVLIDESHNYRSPSTNRHANLMKLLSAGKRKQVILLTATPIQNTLMDLYHQLSLVTSGDDTHFADLGVTDLRRYFIAADRKQLVQGIEDVVRLLDELMIRRTRQFIIENYSDALLNGEPVRFPKRILRKVEYSLTQLFGGAIYKQVLDTIDQLNLVPYRTDSYLITVEEKQRFEVEHRATLQKIGLLKRFESSVDAIRKSIERLEKFYDYFSKALDKDKILDSKTFHKILMELAQEGEENDERFFEALEKAPLVDLTQEYKKQEMKKDIKEDCKLLEPLKQSLARMKPYADRKLIALKEQLVKDEVFDTGGKKAVIFTQFVDTARYVHADLKDALKGKRVELLTGETKPETRERIIREFAPIANTPKGEQKRYVEKEIDVLVSTDILSEGQNLQDANYVVNYDLPWNPMKIVQRAGRVDRLGSKHDTATSAVFIPEKELEDLLGLLEKLEGKIQKIADTIGIETTILGERENPKNFNAATRIAEEDQKLMDDLERSAELLPMETPFNFILTYLKKAGAKSLEALPLGRRSGKLSELNGLVIFYREKTNPEGMHIIYYDYRNGKFDHYNDITWLFRKIASEEDEPLVLPVKGYEGFRQFNLIDNKARQEILTAVNAPLDARLAQKIKPKHQRELTQEILNAFTTGKVSKEKALPIYQILNQENLVAWEDDFAEYMEEYRRQQNIDMMLTAVEQLFQKYRIDLREKRKPKALTPTDLEVVAYMFLSREDFKDMTLEN